MDSVYDDCEVIRVYRRMDAVTEVEDMPRMITETSDYRLRR